MTLRRAPRTIEEMGVLAFAKLRSESSPGRKLSGRPARLPRGQRATAVSLETLSGSWRGALDAADRALRAARSQLPAVELVELEKRLRDERTETARLLRSAARERGTIDPFISLMVPRSQLKGLLGLPANLGVCVFDLDSLLIGAPAAHAAAWAETFDELIAAWPVRAGESVAHFDPRTDYPLHMHGKPRLDGIRAFLASRGIRLPEGTPDDDPGTASVHGLANRKQQVLDRYLDEHGMTAFAGARRYLALVAEAGVHSAVVSASMNTRAMLNRAGLTGTTDLVLDGNAFLNLQMRPNPSPDSMLAACDRLGVEPARAAAFETTAAGVIAARRAGVELTIAVDRSALADALRGEGANLVVADLGELLLPTS